MDSVDTEFYCFIVTKTTTLLLEINDKMKKAKQLTTKQREIRLIDLIKSIKKMDFNKELIEGFEKQLKEIQAELKADKEERKSYNLKIKKNQNDN